MISRYWTSEEKSFIKENYLKMSCIELANSLNRSVVAVHVKKARLCLIKCKKWNYRETLFLKENYLTMFNIEIAKNLNCSADRVSNKLCRLGLKRSKEMVSEHMRNIYVGKTIEEKYGKSKADEIKKNASVRFSGENNPNFGKEVSIETRKKLSKASMGKVPTNLESLHKNMKGKKNPMYGKFGKDHPGYINGKAYEPYPEIWHIGLKRRVRKRDNQICMNCGKHREKLKKALSVHHVNYNKALCVLENLVSLCPKCHSLTNSNRKHWIIFFQSLLSEKYGYEYSESGEIIINFTSIKK